MWRTAVAATTTSKFVCNSLSKNAFVSKQSYYYNYFSTAATKNVTLYQYAICPFCNKVKALLEYQNIQPTIVEVNPLTKAELKWSKDYKKVPIVTIDDKQYNGSDEIMLQGLLSLPKDYEDGDSNNSTTVNEEKLSFVSSPSAKKWINFTNGELAPILYPNLCNSMGNSYKAFSYVHDIPTFSTFQQYSIRIFGSIAMYMAASKVKKRLNITDEKEALKQAVGKIESALLETKNNNNDNTKFLSGTNELNLGDLSVFGALRGLYGLEVFDTLMEQHPTLATWYNAVQIELTKRQQQQQSLQSSE